MRLETKEDMLWDFILDEGIATVGNRCSRLQRNNAKRCDLLKDRISRYGTVFGM